MEPQEAQRRSPGLIEENITEFQRKRNCPGIGAKEGWLKRS